MTLTSSTFHMEHQARLHAIKQWQKIAVNEALIHTCLNCEYWDKRVLGCTFNKAQKGEPMPPIMPPPDIIVFGCSSWERDLPF